MIMEVLPQAIVLPERSISTTRHIAQNPIEFENMLLIINPEVGQESCVILGDE
jgi:hypothetical protein